MESDTKKSMRTDCFKCIKSLGAFSEEVFNVRQYVEGTSRGDSYPRMVSETVRLIKGCSEGSVIGL